MSRLYLIRHGNTEANLQHRYCGSTDLPLSQPGREALEKLQYDVGPVRFLTSGMLRTEQTLAILFGIVPHGQRPAFREADFGIFEMHTYEELKDDPAYVAWITGTIWPTFRRRGRAETRCSTGFWEPCRSFWKRIRCW